MWHLALNLQYSVIQLKVAITNIDICSELCSESTLLLTHEIYTWVACIQKSIRTTWFPVFYLNFHEYNV
jgi:hypothetical protein